MFIKGKVLGIEENDISEKLAIPLSRPMKEIDTRLNKYTMMSSINLKAIQKTNFLNPSAIGHHLLQDLGQMMSERGKGQNSLSQQV